MPAGVTYKQEFASRLQPQEEETPRQGGGGGGDDVHSSQSQQTLDLIIASLQDSDDYSRPLLDRSQRFTGQKHDWLEIDQQAAA